MLQLWIAKSRVHKTMTSNWGACWSYAQVQGVYEHKMNKWRQNKWRQCTIRQMWKFVDVLEVYSLEPCADLPTAKYAHLCELLSYRQRLPAWSVTKLGEDCKFYPSKEMRRDFPYYYHILTSSNKIIPWNNSERSNVLLVLSRDCMASARTFCVPSKQLFLLIRQN